MVARVTWRGNGTDEEYAYLEGHEDDVWEQPVDGEAGNGDVPLLLRKLPHLIDGPLAENHSMEVPVLVVGLDIAVEVECKGVRVECVEVIGLAKSVHCELPVAPDVVLVRREELEFVESPSRKLVVEPLAK